MYVKESSGRETGCYGYVTKGALGSGGSDLNGANVALGPEAVATFNINKVEGCKEAQRGRVFGGPQIVASALLDKHGRQLLDYRHVLHAEEEGLVVRLVGEPKGALAVHALLDSVDSRRPRGESLRGA